MEHDMNTVFKENERKIKELKEYQRDSDWKGI